MQLCTVRGKRLGFYVYGLAAVSSAFGGRRTHGLAVVERAADGRRTVSL
ncbi:MAG: hypothetical protein HXL34_05660 [Prevotellaceae bacterium]|nr:hypothetical protein [Prevotellaceae bacterium]